MQQHNQQDVSLPDAVSRAATATAQLWMVNQIITIGCDTVNRASHTAAVYGHHGLSRTLGFFGHVGHYGMHAFNAVRHGIVDTAAAVIAGGVVEEAVAAVGRRFF